MSEPVNRRDFLKLLAALPGLAFLRPELPKAEPVETILPAWDTEEIYIDFGPKKGEVAWNALGESWRYDGKEWIQDEFAPAYSCLTGEWRGHNDTQ